MGHARSEAQLAECKRMRQAEAAEAAYQRAKRFWDEADATATNTNTDQSSQQYRSHAKTRAAKLAARALAEFQSAGRIGYPEPAAINIMCTFCLTKLERWDEAVVEVKKALALIQKAEEAAAAATAAAASTAPASTAAAEGGGAEGGGAGAAAAAAAAAPQPWSFQGLDRARLVKMAVSLAKLAKAQAAK
jgi:hypothetical protein